ncbi:hypothetical protein D9615_009766 [Tricholomella constricta]|uniref:Uncharacterized protein n=1 Tax=Tricholomella constricta TaxID=117010 RepID=A0A8H5LV45_9AGAR|nr:hypothetical protein D9615_009766 [Tricholomella constricta]
MCEYDYHLPKNQVPEDIVLVDYSVRPDFTPQRSSSTTMTSTTVSTRTPWTPCTCLTTSKPANSITASRDENVLVTTTTTNPSTTRSAEAILTKPYLVAFVRPFPSPRTQHLGRTFRASEEVHHTSQRQEEGQQGFSPPHVVSLSEATPAWVAVSADKDREVHSYQSQSALTPTELHQPLVEEQGHPPIQHERERDEENRQVEEFEADALAVALGFEPTKKTVAPAGSPTAGVSPPSPAQPKPITDSTAKALEKEEKHRRKDARREEKRARKEHRRAVRSSPERQLERERERERLRSHSMRRIDHSAPRALSPRRRSRSPPYNKDRTGREERRGGRRPYDEGFREREREFDRRRWDGNARRERPADGDRVRDRDRGVGRR